MCLHDVPDYRRGPTDISSLRLPALTILEINSDGIQKQRPKQVWVESNGVRRIRGRAQWILSGRELKTSANV